MKSARCSLAGLWGMPVVRKLDTGLWEVRVRIKDRIGRVLFTIEDGEAVLLHGFIKKSQKTPAEELATALERKKVLSSFRKTRR
jgi:phage-related protein